MVERARCIAHMDGVNCDPYTAESCCSRESKCTYNDTCASFLLDGNLWGHAQSDFV